MRTFYDFSGASRLKITCTFSGAPRLRNLLIFMRFAPDNRVDRMVQKLALGATGAKRLHRRAAAVTGVYTEIVEREALLQA